MKRPHNISFLVLLLAALLFGCADHVSRGAAGLIVNHTNWDASGVPAADIARARALDVYFEHASVGNNVRSGIETLAGAVARYDVTRDHYEPGGEHQPTAAELDDIAEWFDANDGFVDFMRGNPGLVAKVSWFVAGMNADVGSPTTTRFATHLDVATFKFCWIDDAYISGDAADEFESVRTAMEALEAQYPAVRFVWWTMPLCDYGTAHSVRFDYNTRVRNYCTANNKPLIDIADIECHDPAGALVTDGSGNEMMYSGYTDDGGHPNVSGEERMANAWWVMMSLLSGWRP